VQLQQKPRVREGVDEESWQEFFQGGNGEDWNALRLVPRLIILAEGGAGKSWEMEGRVDALRKEGYLAFHTDVINLASSTLQRGWANDFRRDFSRWRKGSEIAWFFLDAKDELRLTQQKFEKALRQFASEIDGQMNRAHIVISSRGSDWRGETDLALVESILPYLVAQSSVTENPKNTLRARAVERNTSTSDWLKVFKLQPLQLNQVRVLAAAHNVPDVPDLIAALESTRSQRFVRRPLDAIRIFTHWRVERRLGTLKEQIQRDIEASLGENPERPYPARISIKDAIHHARKLALGLMFCRKPFLALQNEASSADVSDCLDCRIILGDVVDEDREALLSRALFDIPTFGRTSFHHRSTLEFLAAEMLTELKRLGLSSSRVLGCLFAEQYGESVTLP
jgi:hypothetical protein